MRSRKRAGWGGEVIRCDVVRGKSPRTERGVGFPSQPEGFQCLARAAAPEQIYQRPSRPRESPCSTTLPLVVREPCVGAAGTKTCPLSWLVGWAIDVSQRPK